MTTTRQAALSSAYERAGLRHDVGGREEPEITHTDLQPFRELAAFQHKHIKRNHDQASGRRIGADLHAGPRALEAHGARGTWTRTRSPRYRRLQAQDGPAAKAAAECCQDRMAGLDADGASTEWGQDSTSRAAAAAAAVAAAAAMDCEAGHSEGELRELDAYRVQHLPALRPGQAGGVHPEQEASGEAARATGRQRQEEMRYIVPSYTLDERLRVVPAALFNMIAAPCRSDQLSSFEWAKSDVPPTLKELGIDPNNPASWPEELQLESFSIPASRFQPDPDQLRCQAPRRARKAQAQAQAQAQARRCAEGAGDSLSLYQHLVPYCVHHRRRCQA